MVWLVVLRLRLRLRLHTAVDIRRRGLRRARLSVLLLLLLLGTLESIVVEARIYCKLALRHLDRSRERRGSFAPAIHPRDGHTFTHRAGGLLAVESVHDEQKGR